MKGRWTVRLHLLHTNISESLNMVVKEKDSMGNICNIGDQIKSGHNFPAPITVVSYEPSLSALRADTIQIAVPPSQSMIEYK